jgi:hypothetical protein
MPKDVTPWLTALRAYSICTSLPLGEKVVSEKEYLSAMAECVMRGLGRKLASQRRLRIDQVPAGSVE